MSLIRFQDPLWPTFAWPAASRSRQPVAQWTPPTDIYDAGQAFVLTLDVPGVDQNEVDIQLEENNVLTVRGERQAPANGSGEGFALRERRTGAFGRSFRLPVAVDAERIEARYDRGVLEIHIPKVDRSRKIPIQ